MAHDSAQIVSRLDVRLQQAKRRGVVIDVRISRVKDYIRTVRALDGGPRFSDRLGELALDGVGVTVPCLLRRLLFGRQVVAERLQLGGRPLLRL